MRPATKLAAFGLVLGAAFGVGSAIGSVAGPIEVTDPAPAHEIDADHGGEHPAPTTTLVPAGHGDHEDPGPSDPTTESDR